MAAWILRIWTSFLTLPKWVIAWICLGLVPANFSGFLFLETVSGRWIALLGAGGIILNLIPVLANGGFSKVLCIPHLLFWTPLVAILGARLVGVQMSDNEFRLALTVFLINAASLCFDVYDFNEWRRGNRDVAGFPGLPVRM